MNLTNSVFVPLETDNSTDQSIECIHKDAVYDIDNYLLYFRKKITITEDYLRKKLVTNKDVGIDTTKINQRIEKFKEKYSEYKKMTIPELVKLKKYIRESESLAENLAHYLVLQFKREKSTLSNIFHPCIVHMPNTENDEDVKNEIEMESDDAIYTPLIPGIDLYHLLQGSEPSLTYLMKLKIIYGVAHAIRHLHRRNLCHRDLSYNNIIVLHDGFPVLIDFYGTKDISGGEDRQTHDNCYSGTSGFVPQESVQENYSKYDFKSEVWAFSSILFYIFTNGQIIQNSDSSFETVFEQSRLMSNFQDLYLMCANIDPLERPSFEEIVAILNSNTRSEYLELTQNEKEDFFKYRETINKDESNNVAYDKVCTCEEYLDFGNKFSNDKKLTFIPFVNSIVDVTNSLRDLINSK